MEDEQEIFTAKNGRPFIKVPYITSTGKNALRCRFIKNSDLPESQEQAVSGEGIKSELLKQAFPKILKQALSPEILKQAFKPKLWAQALKQVFKPMKGTKVGRGSEEAEDLREMHDSVIARLLEKPDIEESGFFNLLEKLASKPKTAISEFLELVKPARGGRILAGPLADEIIGLPRFPRTINMADLRRLQRSREEISGSGIGSGITSALISVGLPLLIKGLSKLFSKKKK